MEKLTLKEIVGYLPYGLKVLHIDTDEFEQVEITTELESACSESLTFKDGADFYFEDSDVTIKPILYPLSMLTKPINHNGVEIIPIDEINKIHTLEFKDGLFNDYVSDGFHIEWLPKLITDKLFEWHFDIHDLIERGLAIDKSKI